MKTNKEKALEELDKENRKALAFLDKHNDIGQTGENDSLGLMSFNRGKNMAFCTSEPLIELAAKPDWFHPSKGEFPDNNTKVIVEGNPCFGEELTLIYIRGDEGFWKKNIKAWTYLPTFNEK